MTEILAPLRGRDARAPSQLFLFLILLLFSRPVYALASGEPLQNNAYQIDLTRTVVTGSTRKIALGGAFTGIAEGVAAIPDNPAAVAYRPRAFMNPLELDMVLSTLATGDDDADNSGTQSLVYGNQALMDLGLMAQYQNWGVGFEAQMAVFQSENLPQNQEAQLMSGSFATGYTTDDRTIAVGLSLDPIGARVHPMDDHSPRSFKLRGIGYGAGVLFHPGRGAWRFGAAYNSAVSSDERLVVAGTEPVKVGNLIVPEGVWQTDILSLGLAHETNSFWGWRGHPGLASGDIRFFGRSPSNAQGSAAFVTQTVRPVGQKLIATLHGGLEAEVVPGRLRLRAGTYREPSRYEGISARQHITGGFEIRLFPIPYVTRDASLSYAVDYTSRYQVYSLSLWLWSFAVPVPNQ